MWRRDNICACRNSNSGYHPLCKKERKYLQRETASAASLLSSNPMDIRVMCGGISSEGYRVCCFLFPSSNPLEIRVMYGGISTLKFIRKILSLFRLINRKRNGTDSDTAYSVSCFANAPQMAQDLNYAAHWVKTQIITKRIKKYEKNGTVKRKGVTSYAWRRLTRFETRNTESI